MSGRPDVLEEVYRHVLRLAVSRYRDVVRAVARVESGSGVLVKVRVVFVDESFLDVYWSPTGRYSLHYERRHVDGTVYRHDNAPHWRHRRLRTFPKHFHAGSEDNVEESRLPDDPLEAVEAFLRFIERVVKQREE